MRLFDQDEKRLFLALSYGAVCHGLFALGVGAMIWAMYHGLQRSFGAVAYPWAIAANLALLLQFPLVHSLLLTKSGRGVLAKLGPAPHGKALATTNFSIIASVQLMLVFLLWSPSNLMIWEAEGWAKGMMTCLYAASWLFLVKAILDSDWRLQSGALGWLAVALDRAPKFPDLPEDGLYRFVRQPIYLAFALTLWTTPTWSADQLVLACAWTVYCVAAPVLKERRFRQIYGDRFERYQARVPYWLPIPKPKEATHGAAETK